MLNHFHVNVFSRPKDKSATRSVRLGDVLLSAFEPGSITAFFPLTFEQAMDALGRLPRLDAEPDGFFVVAGQCDGQPWQVDGHLFDFDDRVHRVELHGSCPEETLDAILGCLDWPRTPLAFELVREGVAVDEPSFRRWARPS